MKKKLICWLLMLALLLSCAPTALAADKPEEPHGERPYQRLYKDGLPYETDKPEFVKNGEFTAQSAEDWEDWRDVAYKTEGDWKYYVNHGGASVTITDYLGSAASVITPATLGGKPVTIIGSGAFEERDDIDSVTISEGVTQLGDAGCEFEFDASGVFGNVFSYSRISSISLPASLAVVGWACFNSPWLETITVASGNTTFRVTDGVLFDYSSGDDSVLLCYPALKTGASYTVPPTVEKIAPYAISYCVYLEAITIPASVTASKYGVYNCPNLTTATIQEGVASIGGFEACWDLATVNFPSTLTAIEDWSFCGSDVLTSVALPNGLQTIGYGVFSMTALTGITIPAFVTSIGTFAFGDCWQLAAINVNGGNAHYKSPNGVLFTKDGQTLMMCPAGKTGASYMVPNGTVTLSDGAFSNARLQQIGLPQSLRVIGESAFWSSGLTGIAIPQNVSFIGVGAFMYNNNLAQVAVYSDAAVYEAYEWGEETFYKSPHVVLYGNPGSTTQAYAARYGLPFGFLTIMGISCTAANATTYGGANGSITIAASGSLSGGYEYSLNGGGWQASGVFGGLAAGTYTAAVRDAVYTTNVAAQSVTIGQPPHKGAVPAKKLPAKPNAGTALTIVPPAAPKGYTITSVTYSSSNPSVASVDGNGNVTFLAGGKATIITKVVSQMTDKKGKIKTKTTTAKKAVTVQQPVASISLSAADATIARKAKLKLTANLAPGTASNKKLTWKSSNPKVAAVSSAGVVTGKAGGTAVITCTAKDGSGASASCTVTVTPIYPTGVKLNKSVITVKPGKTASLKATVLPKTTDFKTVTWTSSNPAVVTVDAKGKLKAIAAGTAVITATTSTGLSASCTVTVP